MTKYIEKTPTRFKVNTLLTFIKNLTDGKAEFEGTKVIKGILEERDCQGSDILDWNEVREINNES